MSDSTYPDPALPTPELLARQVDWLRRLARDLVGDHHLAEDVVQDAMLRALERPPRDPAGLAGWLRQVVRNRFREGLRESGNRRARERESARSEATPGPDELVERLHVQRRIADHLLDLDERTRTAVLLRFYEDLPPREIARRTGEPVATVKSRLQRGLAKLRERLDTEHGGERSAWALALVPLLRDATPVAATTIGGITMGAKAWTAAGVLAALGTWFWIDRAGSDDPGAGGDLARAAQVGVPDAGGGAGADPRDGRGAERSVLEPVDRSPATAIEPAGEAPTYTLRGRVLDFQGQPVMGVPVRVLGRDDRTIGQFAMSSGAGLFELETTLTDARCESASDRWVAVRTGSWRADGSLEPVLVVAPAIEVSGDVVDAWGRPVQDARLKLVLPDDLETRIGYTLDASIQEGWSAVSRDDGRFELGRIPAIAVGELRTVASGYAPRTEPAPLASTDALTVELVKPQPASGLGLAGRVVRPSGEPASEALVAVGVVSTQTDADGAFVLDLERAGNTRELRAVEAGFLPVSLERPDRPSATSSGWPEFVEVRLEAASLSITGRVVDTEGTPRSGGRVWLASTTPFGVVGTMPVQVEALASGAPLPSEAIDSLAQIASASREQEYGSASPVFEPNAIVHWASLDDEGRFELTGLTEREYVLHVAGDGLEWGTVTDPIEAGSEGVEIAVPAELAWERVRGRVVTTTGEPVSGVAISSWVTALRRVVEVQGGTSDVTRFFMGQSVRTDEDGRFELEGLPKQGVQFHLISDEIVPSYTSVEAIDDPDAFVIEVLGRAHFELTVVPGPDAPDAFRVTDATGRELEILEMKADGYSNYDRFELTDGRSGVLTLTTDAAFLHLLRGQEELDVLPLSLRTGEVTRIAW